jgi:hypothetical protein
MPFSPLQEGEASKNAVVVINKPVTTKCDGQLRVMHISFWLTYLEEKFLSLHIVCLISWNSTMRKLTTSCEQLITA